VNRSPTTVAKTANERAFDAWLDRFFAHYYATRPVNATFTGLHDHDHALPDFSPAATARQLLAMRQLREELAEIPTRDLDTARHHDALIADGYLELQTMEDSLPQFHRGNPALYTSDGVFAILSLFLRDAEPLSARVATAIARMRALPEFLAQARANVSSAPVAWTDHAHREARASAEYFAKGLPRLAIERGITNPEFLRTAAVARDAYLEHAAWLDGTLRRHPSEALSCGREAFDRYLSRGHFLPPDRDTTWLAGFASRAHRDARATLEERAAALDPVRSWPDQLADLADRHPSPNDYYAAFSRLWNAAQTAAIEADLVTWPEFPIDYVPIPESDREAFAGLYYLPYRCPPPFGRPETHRYLVPPLAPAREPAAQQRQLRATNDAVIKLNHVVHHGGLGHHVQNWYAFQSPYRIGQIAGVDCASRIAIFAAGTLVEGWACYATDLMEEIGFLTPLESLSQAQSRLRMAARAVADVALHTGAMSLDETVDFYEREAGMPASAARREAIKNSMFPGAAMMYLVGTEDLHHLRRQIAERDGNAFSRRAFHDRVLHYGAIPTALIARDMLNGG
jgi:IS5 family transposase